jgi:hypothetical protein
MSKVSVATNQLLGIVFLLSLQARNTQSYNGGSSSSSQGSQEEKKTDPVGVIVGLVVLAVLCGIAWAVYRYFHPKVKITQTTTTIEN